LLGKVSFEEQFQIRVEFEEPGVKELGSGLSDWGDLPEAILNEFDLFICHDDVLLIYCGRAPARLNSRLLRRKSFVVCVITDLKKSKTLPMWVGEDLLSIRRVLLPQRR
jgi:hypothetical protein